MSSNENDILDSEFQEYLNMAKKMLYDQCLTQFETIKKLESKGLDKKTAETLVRNLKQNKEVIKEYDQKAFYLGLFLFCLGLFLRIFLVGLVIYGIIGFGIYLMIKNGNSFNKKDTE